MKKLLKTAQIFDEIAALPNSNVTVNHREVVVKTLENFLNRVKISKPLASVKFNTTSIAAEVNFIWNGLFYQQFIFYSLLTLREMINLKIELKSLV